MKKRYVIELGSAVFYENYRIVLSKKMSKKYFQIYQQFFLWDAFETTTILSFFSNDWNVKT